MLEFIIFPQRMQTSQTDKSHIYIIQIPHTDTSHKCITVLLHTVITYTLNIDTIYHDLVSVFHLPREVHIVRKKPWPRTNTHIPEYLTHNQE